MTDVEIQKNLADAFRARPDVLYNEANQGLIAECLAQNLREPTTGNIIQAIDKLLDVLAKRIEPLPVSSYVEDDEPEPAQPADPETARQQAFDAHQARLRQLSREMQSPDPAVRAAAKKALKEIVKTEPKGIYKVRMAF